MRRRRRILLAVGLAAVGGVALWAIHGEPRHGGKSLSAWLNTYGAGPGGYKPSTNADNALRHIGPKAVPYLLEMLHATNSSTNNRFVRKSPPPKAAPNVGTGPGAFNWVVQASPITNQPAWMKLVEKYTPFRVQRTSIRASWAHWKAYLGFQALGSLGKDAIPELVKLAHEPGPASSYPNIESMKQLEIVALTANSDPCFMSLEDVRIGSYSYGFSTGSSSKCFLIDGEIAAWSLAAIGADAVPALMKLLSDSNPRLRARAAQALGMAGSPAEPAVPELVKMLNDSELDVRIRAADALGWIERRPEVTIPALTEALTDREMGVAFYAAESLGRFRERATNAIPALLRNFTSTDYRIRQSAATALGKISRETFTKEILPVLLRDIKDPQATVRNTALLTLSGLRDEADLVIPVLIEALDDNDTSIRNNAINILGRFGPKASAAVPKLLSLRTTQDSDLRGYITSALTKIEPDKQWGR